VRSHNAVVRKSGLAKSLIGGVLMAGLAVSALPGCSADSSSKTNSNNSNANANSSTGGSNSNSSGPGALTTPSPSWVLEWSKIANDASMTDHTPGGPGDKRGEHMGPVRAARALAIAHVAIVEAMVAIHGGFKSYAGVSRETAKASTRAAVATAAHATLTALFTGQKAELDAKYEAYLDGEPDGDAKSKGVAVGKKAADAILELRENDGANHADPVVGVDYTCSTEPNRWRPDPISGRKVAMGAKWAQVKPFVIKSAQQFRCPPPPATGSPELAAAFDEVKRYGGDGLVTATERSLHETIVGLYWAYDGAPGLGVPPRLYNQIVWLIAAERGTGALDLAKLLALVNVGMADAGLACWESKYFHDLARPVTAIREADIVTEGGDPNFTPLGAPSSNTAGPNFTPPFPAYPSGHSTFGGVTFQVLRNFYKTDAISFTFISDELDGKTKDITGQTRPRVTRTFQNLAEAEEENGQSRIYLGIHWSFDKTEGIAQGRKVADFVSGMMYLPTAP
jgi:membrane-associated phospholipid phosphatase